MRKVMYAVLGGIAFIVLWQFLPSDTVTVTPPENARVSGPIVAVGESLAAGVGAPEGKGFVAILSREIGEDIINLGVSGQTTAEARAALGDALELEPRLVLLQLGGNDAIQDVPSAETFANLRYMIDTLQADGAQVILLGVRGGIFRDTARSQFDQLAADTNVAYVPDILDGLFGNDDLMSDPIHPNAAGYQQIADRVLPVLQAAQ
jgi:lysophospholipase L1-like esterase